MEKEKFIVKTILIFVFVLIFGFIYINFVREDEFLILESETSLEELKTFETTLENDKSNLSTKENLTNDLSLKKVLALEETLSESETYEFIKKENHVSTISVIETETENSNSKTKININKADISQLCELPSIGEATAKLIIEYREIYGDFKEIKQIKNVKRIGEKTYQKIKDLICVD